MDLAREEDRALARRDSQSATIFHDVRRPITPPGTQIQAVEGGSAHPAPAGREPVMKVCGKQVRLDERQIEVDVHAGCRRRRRGLAFERYAPVLKDDLSQDVTGSADSAHCGRRLPPPKAG